MIKCKKANGNCKIQICVDLCNKNDCKEYEDFEPIRKEVLKLDKNFHIYIHGNHELIEKGFDSNKKMNYYKVYYNTEN